MVNAAGVQYCTCSGVVSDTGTEVEFTIFPPSRVYLGFLKLRLELRFQAVAIHPES
jgi:hypothetical protein